MIFFCPCYSNICPPLATTPTPVPITAPSTTAPANPALSIWLPAKVLDTT
ncbi:hypothetical protein AO368_1815 [Moraxella catarrhalis]|nr:hypothetical protein AO368_1815 [Moraxella catarrhalis]